MPPWLLWSVLALLSWGIWAVMSRLIGDALSAAHSQALSTIGLLPVMLAIALSRRLSAPSFRNRGVLYSLAGGTLACFGNMAYYDALNRGGKAATLASLTALYPLVTIALAVTLLRERLNRVQLAGVVLSLAAIYLFNVEREEGFLSGGLSIVLAPIAFWGVAGFFQKLATNHASGEVSTLCFLAAFIPVAGVLLTREALPEHIASRTWWLVAALGLFFALGNLAMLFAFASHGKASVITPLTALYPVVSVPIAILFLGERIDWRETLGIVLALVSVAALSCETAPAAPVSNPSNPAPRP